VGVKTWFKVRDFSDRAIWLNRFPSAGRRRRDNEKSATSGKTYLQPKKD